MKIDLKKFLLEYFLIVLLLLFISYNKSVKLYTNFKEMEFENLFPFLCDYAKF